MAEIGIHQQVKLQDGRMLGYAEYGAPQGVPVFYFHGFPGSRLDYLLSDAGDAAMETNARIIAADRPGLGLSDFKPGRTILDWPDDVGELADALAIDRFAVLGISGGGPYAAACAVRLPGRLTTTGIVSGMGPSNAPGMKDGVSWTISAEVHLWHGGQDNNVPVSVGHHVADAIPDCNARFYKEEGHLTLPHNRMREVLSTLLA